MATPEDLEPALSLLYTSETDKDTDESLVEEMYYSQVQRHPYYVLNQVVALNIYGEPEAEPVYELVTPQFPFHIKLDPEVELLEKFGYDRVRDCVAWFCSKIMRDIGVAPKVGDRFDLLFTNEAGNVVREQFEIHEVSPTDFSRQALNPYQITAACDRTHKAKKPDAS